MHAQLYATAKLICPLVPVQENYYRTNIHSGLAYICATLLHLKNRHTIMIYLHMMERRLIGLLQSKQTEVATVHGA